MCLGAPSFAIFAKGGSGAEEIATTDARESTRIKPTEKNDFSRRAAKAQHQAHHMTTATQHKKAGTGMTRIIVATSFSFVVTQLDVTIVNVALPHIASGLSVHVAGLQWVVDAYTLPFAVLMLSAGVLGDRFGSRRTYLIGLGIFAAASLACGLAPNIATLIAARAAQGAGAALLIPSSLALLSHAAANDHSLRARAVGLWTASGGIGIAAGPVIGGLLVAGMGWRSIFLVNVPLCAAGALLTIRTVSSNKHGDATHHLDPVGQLLSILALTGLTCSVIEFRPLGIHHPLVIGGAILAVVAGIGFYIAETKSSEPMLPFGLFHLPNFSPSVIFGTIVNLTLYGTIFVLTLYLQQARGFSALRAGLAYLPLMSTFIISNVASGVVASRTGPRLPMIAGAAVAVAGYALMSRLGTATPYFVMLLPFLVLPAGIGFAVPAMTAAVLSSVDRRRSGTASAVLNAARQTGGAIGVAIFGALVGSTPIQIVQGLRMASLISAALLLIATLVAWKSIRRTHGTVEIGKRIGFQID
jgi:DHA2 family methylenomycin A resistance protein-like MFS transporter